MRPRVPFLAAATALATVASSALLAAAGCAADEELPDVFAVNTAISVTPNEFLLGVPCSPGAGAMKSYVAVVTDRGPVDSEGNTPADYAFDLPASPPTPCTATVAFRHVVVGHRYEARVYAYDLDAKGLVPGSAGCATEFKNVTDADGNPTQIEVLVPGPGSTLLCQNPTGEEGGWAPVMPAWTRSCGTQGSGAAVARSSVEVRVAGCIAEGDNGNVGTGETAIVVDPLVAMAPPLSCLPAGGDEPAPEQIDTFDVIPEDAALPDQVGVDCDAGGNPPPAATYTDVDPGVSYRFRIEAGNAEAPARWATTCDAVAFEGVAVTASCDTLTDRGTMRVELADCPDGATYHLRATNADTGEELALGDGTCPGPATVSGVPSGRYELVATIDAPDAEPLELVCQATVAPAATTTVECPGRASGASD
jgi:hypothetical protein